MPTINKLNCSLFIALLFHVSGLIGILFTSYQQWFIAHTPLNLLLMAVLVIWNAPERNKYFYLFILLCFVTGMIAEIIGVNTGYLFGSYSYGLVMGLQLKGVPLLIGIYWFITVYAAGVAMHLLHERMEQSYAEAGLVLSKKIQTLSLIIDGAILAVFFDWIMEPVAGKLGFWQWNNNAVIPVYNYVCWFVISALLLLAFRFCGFKKENYFAVHLFIIQALFFAVLRTCL